MYVSVPPDQFQKRTYVKLPYSDAFLSGRNTRRVERELRLAFLRPLITVQIAEVPLLSELHRSAHSVELPQTRGPMYGDAKPATRL